MPFRAVPDYPEWATKIYQKRQGKYCKETIQSGKFDNHEHELFCLQCIEDQFTEFEWIQPYNPETHWAGYNDDAVMTVYDLVLSALTFTYNNPRLRGELIYNSKKCVWAELLAWIVTLAPTAPSSSCTCTPPPSTC